MGTPWILDGPMVDLENHEAVTMKTHDSKDQVTCLHEKSSVSNASLSLKLSLLFHWKKKRNYRLSLREERVELLTLRIDQ